MLDPDALRCQLASDPRDSPEEHERRAGEQYTGKPFVMPDGKAHPNCGTDDCCRQCGPATL